MKAGLWPLQQWNFLAYSLTVVLSFNGLPYLHRGASARSTDSNYMFLYTADPMLRDFGEDDFTSYATIRESGPL